MNDKEKTTRVYAFIDSQNLNVSTQKVGWKMDWRKFRKYLTDKYGVSKAFLFIGYIPENENMYEQMHDLGYAVVLKPTFDITKPMPEQGKNEENSQEKRPVKGNIDAELVLWAMKEMSNYDKAILVSGDGDFYCLIEYLEEKKRLLKILAPTGHYSSLFNKYEKYIERLDHSRRQLEYHDRPGKNRNREPQK